MPVRYTRKLQPSLLVDASLAQRSNELSALIADAASISMPESNGWSMVSVRGDDLLNQEYRYGDFLGVISLVDGIDVKSIRGEGMVRSSYLMVSATCQDKRKVDAQVAEAEVVQGFEKVFSMIGAGVIGFLGLFVQVAVLRVISWEVTIGCFFVGFFLGGLTGYMLGEPISLYLGRKSNVKTDEDHVDLGVARAEWSQFIESIIEPIESFSKEVEEFPSVATII